MVNELPEILDIGTIPLEPGIPFYYQAWGFRYRYKTGNWRISPMSFGKKSDAEEWMKEKYLKFEGMEGEIIPVKRTLLLDEKGNIKTETEELTE